MSDPTRKDVNEFIATARDGQGIEIAMAYLRTKKLVTQLRSSRRKDRAAMLAAIEVLDLWVNSGYSLPPGQVATKVLEILRARVKEKL